MKIVFLTASMVGGGTERVIAILSNYFAGKNYDVEIVMTADDKIEYELDSHIVVTQLTKRTMGSIAARINRICLLRKHMTNNKKAVYLSFGTETNLFAIISGSGILKRLILSERNDPAQCKFIFLRNALYKLGKEFVFQTKDAKNYFNKRIQERSKVIANPISNHLPDVYCGIRQKKVVAVGRLTEQKNYPLMIQAFAKFAENYPQYQLMIYGKGHLENKLKELVLQMKLEEIVIFVGFESNISNAIKDARMYLLSSDYEGISNSLLEAMAMGLPVISTDCPIGGSRMLIEEGVNGLLVPVGDCKSLVQAMKKIAEDSVFADKLGSEAAKVRELYSVECICKLWEAVID